MTVTRCSCSEYQSYYVELRALGSFVMDKAGSTVSSLGPVGSSMYYVGLESWYGCKRSLPLIKFAWGMR